MPRVIKAAAIARTSRISRAMATLVRLFPHVPAQHREALGEPGGAICSVSERF